MSDQSIVDILVDRDRLSREEAIEQVRDAHELLLQYLEDGEYGLADDICQDEFGLEPDYLIELMSTTMIYGKG